MESLNNNLYVLKVRNLLSHLNWSNPLNSKSIPVYLLTLQTLTENRGGDLIHPPRTIIPFVPGSQIANSVQWPWNQIIYPLNLIWPNGKNIPAPEYALVLAYRKVYGTKNDQIPPSAVTLLSLSVFVPQRQEIVSWDHILIPFLLFDESWLFRNVSILPVLVHFTLSL